MSRKPRLHCNFGGGGRLKLYAVSSRGLSSDPLKCGSCLWRADKLYVQASSREEALELVKRGEGLCAECMCESLAEEVLLNRRGELYRSFPSRKALGVKHRWFTPEHYLPSLALAPSLINTSATSTSLLEGYETHLHPSSLGPLRSRPRCLKRNLDSCSPSWGVDVLRLFLKST